MFLNTTNFIFYLQQANSDGHGHAQRTQRSLPLRDRPGVTLQLPQQVGKVHVDLLHWLQEPDPKPHHNMVTFALKMCVLVYYSLMVRVGSGFRVQGQGQGQGWVIITMLLCYYVVIIDELIR